VVAPQREQWIGDIVAPGIGRSPDWPADRLGTLERNILRIGVYELEEQTVPHEVAINEAVVLAKRYARRAARLVNGVLARLHGRRPRPRSMTFSHGGQLSVLTRGGARTPSCRRRRR
jgi:hypothetical protein